MNNYYYYIACNVNTIYECYGYCSQHNNIPLNKLNGQENHKGMNMDERVIGTFL